MCVLYTCTSEAEFISVDSNTLFIFKEHSRGSRFYYIRN